MTVGVDQVAAVIAHRRWVYSSERELQIQLARVLEAAFPGLVRREVRLSGAAGRLDFAVGPIAVEVKIGGSLSALTRQVHRYAGHDDVAGVVAVVGRSRLLGLPEELRGKPVRVVYLSGAL